MKSINRLIQLALISLAVIVIWLISPNDTQAALNCDDPGVICKSGTLGGDETWTSSNIYVITGDDLVIPSGVTLTIDAGTIVKITHYYRDLIVDGHLEILGQNNNPAYITSINDDIGGDTNHDTETPDRGDWGGVIFRGGSSGTLNYVEFRYGGDDDSSNGGMLFTEGGTNVAVDHGVFRNSEYCAINSNPGWEPTLTNMTWQDFTGSTFNGLCLHGESISNNATWDETEVAYVILNDLTVTTGYSLTWGPGIVVKPRTYHIDLFVDGTLNAYGEDGSRIYVTSIKDDSVGGQTNDNADPAGRGEWGSVRFMGGSSGTLDYVEFRYGGDDDSSDGGMLFTEGGTNVTVDHGVFRNSEYCAINSNPGWEPTLTNMTWQDFTGSTFNGLCLHGESISNNATWDETEVAYVILNDLTVTTGYSLTWGPGIVVKPRTYYIDLFVDGTLNAYGEADKYIYYTSIKDDSHGGNTDGESATPDIGNWETITFRDSSNGNLSFVIIQYGDDGIQVKDAIVSILNSILRYSEYGLRSSGPSVNVVINNSNIYGNSKYGVYNDISSVWLDATNNWWGNISGPYDPSSSGTDGDYNDTGTGDRVNDYVLYRPWSIGNLMRTFLPLTIKNN